MKEEHFFIGIMCACFLGISLIFCFSLIAADVLIGLR